MKLMEYLNHLISRLGVIDDNELLSRQVTAMFKLPFTNRIKCYFKTQQDSIQDYDQIE